MIPAGTARIKMATLSKQVACHPSVSAGDLHGIKLTSPAGLASAYPAWPAWRPSDLSGSGGAVQARRGGEEVFHGLYLFSKRWTNSFRSDSRRGRGAMGVG